MDLSKIVISNKIKKSSQEYKSLIIKYDWCSSKDEYIYALINNIKNPPKCQNEYCSLKPNFISFSKGYYKTCSKQCPAFKKEEIVMPEIITKDFLNQYIIKDNKITKSSLLKKINIPSTFWNQNKNEFIYSILNDIKEQPVCNICNTNYLNFKSIQLGYHQTCSPKCAQSNNETRLKHKETIFKKYGVENISQIEDVKHKKAYTLNKNFGVDSPLQSEKIKDKVKKTLIQKYGVDNISKSEEIKETKKQTLLKNFGVDHPLRSEEIKLKLIQTNIDKYGVDNVSKLDATKNKKSITNLNKLGVENPFQSIDIKNKIKENNQLLNGADYFKQNHFKNQLDFHKEFIEDKFIEIKNDKRYLKYDAFLKYFNFAYSTGFHKLESLNIEYYRVTDRFKTEIEIFNFIKNILKDKESRIYRKKRIISYKNETGRKIPLELDIYIELLKNGEVYKKFAIEYNGLMHHSFGISNYSMFNNIEDENKTKTNHLRKTELCEEQNIQLLHINENEWLSQQDIWKSIIQAKLGLNEVIYARKCILSKISYKEKRKFMIENHIQGDGVSKWNYGLYYKNELVSVMTFGLSRYNKNYDYELMRFASKIGFNIVGGGSRLLKAFKKEFNGSLISYGNRRWTASFNNFYESNGFELLNKSAINYYYFHSKNIFKIYHRQMFQKHKIKSYYDEFKFEILFYDGSLSSNKNLSINGWRRIYDSGQLVYVFR